MGMSSLQSLTSALEPPPSVVPMSDAGRAINSPRGHFENQPAHHGRHLDTHSFCLSLSASQPADSNS